MAEDSGSEGESTSPQRSGSASGLGLALALAALAAVGAGIAVQQILERRLSKPEIARLKFYRYLRERGILES